ncbi:MULTISPECIES: hypothetical protein [unclassified Luteococcus]|uniref:hypothetical protein n=1 Tax=unclassified Luteococcus TaxID=2639923 RepID=UPI00313E735D
MEMALSFGMLRPTRTDGGLALVWQRLQRDLDPDFWASRKSTFLEHWLAETGYRDAFERAARKEPPPHEEEREWLLDALHEDSVAYQRLVRDGQLRAGDELRPACIPVPEGHLLVPVVIHLIRGWYPVDDVAESFQVLEAWADDATQDDLENALESLPAQGLPACSVLARLREGELPPVKPERTGSSEPTALEVALWDTLKEISDAQQPNPQQPSDPHPRAAVSWQYPVHDGLG